MKFYKILLLIGFFVFVNNIAFAQYDDDDQTQSKRGSKRERISAPKMKQSSGVKNSKNRNDLFRSSANKTTHLSKKEQSKIMAKKEQNKNKKYNKTRKQLQNAKTIKRMKKNERHSYAINAGRNAPFFTRIAKSLNPTHKKNRRKTMQQSSELQKRQDKARDKYESTYRPNSSKKKKEKKRVFSVPLLKN